MSIAQRLRAALQRFVFPGLEDFPMLASELRVLRYDEDGLINPDAPWKSNIVFDDSRTDMLSGVLGFGDGYPGAFPYLGIGSNATAAVATQTGLLAELTGNATRKTLTNLDGDPFTTDDLIQETSGNRRWKVVTQAQFGTGDGNNGSNFAEYSIANQAAFGGGSSFYNRTLYPTFGKTSAQNVLAQLVFRM